ncbi:MAG: hypothetical protein Q4F66_01255 [Clostridium sp.]|nr:hypothetical protein [Clostridium sp.]
MMIRNEISSIDLIGHENVYLNEEEYIKSYLRCICAFKGLSRTLSPILYAFCNFIEYDKDSDCKIIHITGRVVDEICAITDLKSARINKALRDLVNVGIFTKVPHKRAMYVASSYVIAKEEMHKLKELKANINFTKGFFEICLEGSAVTS